MLLTLNRLTRSAFPENWRELDRMFEGLFGTRFAGATHAGALFPSLNLLADEHNLYVEATVPGLALEDVEVNVRGDQLRISGTRQLPREEKTRCLLLERGSGVFDRTLQLPVAVDAEQTTAELRNGILTVTMPKAQKTRRIEVKGSRPA